MIAEFVKASSLGEALEVLAERGQDCRVIAGGTDVMMQLHRGEISEGTLLGISSLPELCRIRANGSLSIGALATHARIGRDEQLGGFAALSEAARTVGGWQTQSVGTIGGNIANASPAADLAAPLLANDAAIELRSSTGDRTVSYSDFVLGRRATIRRPDELVTQIVLPAPPVQSADVYIKVGRRSAMEVAIVGLALRLTFGDSGTVTDARLALASVGPVPMRLPSAEAALVGTQLDTTALDDAAHEALDAIAPIDDLRATGEYRRAVLGGILHRAASICRTRINAISRQENS